jgi:glycosyltransferase involved in cell wall biosynthesis
MKILIVLTYYRPHISGLTIYAERLAKAFAALGHNVTILTSQFEKSLPREEVIEGIRIIRAPVLFRLSKGVIMPTFGWLASKLASQTDVIQLHLPQFDAAGISLRGRLLKKPTVITYHCDLLLPSGLLNRVANMAVSFMNWLTAIFTHRIVTYTRDYAENSKYLNQRLHKVQIIPPPVVLPGTTPTLIQAFADIHNPENKKPVIGMAARFATEKGVEVLLKALPKILERYPDALVQFVGPYQNIVGEEDYFQRLIGQIKEFEQSGNWQFLGSLNPDQMAAFFPNLDVLVLPSLNSTEAFGLVQIEAMMNGVPCVASSLPGVRQPVMTHKMGKVFTIGDAKALANSILEVLDQKASFSFPQVDFSMYSPEKVAREYEHLFEQTKEELR